MKKLLILFSVLFALGASAQSTTITSTIIDPLGNSWNYGTVTAVFQRAPGTGTPAWSGGTLNPIPPTVNLTSGGGLTMTLPSTNYITPSGGTWVFSVCPNSSQQCAVFSTAVIGTTLDINPLITAANAWPSNLVISTPIAKVYNVNQTFAPPLSQGGMLYDTTTQSMLVYTSTGWQPFATVGSGVPILSNPSGSQTITQPTNTNFNFTTSGTGGVYNNGNQMLYNNFSGAIAFLGPLTTTIIAATGVTATSVNSPLIGTTAPGTGEFGVLNNIVNASSCGYASPPAWCSGADLGAWINSAFAHMAGTSGSPTLNAVVTLDPNESHAPTTMIVIPSQHVYPYINSPILDCNGATLGFGDYLGTGDAIQVLADDSPLGLSGAIRNCNIYGNSVTAVGVHQFSRIEFTYSNDYITGFAGSTQVGVLLDNVASGWNERTGFIDDEFANNYISIKALGEDGGTNSFARTIIQNMFCGTTGAQTCLQLMGNNTSVSAFMYDSYIDIRGNGTGSASTAAIDLYQGGAINSSVLNIGIEGFTYMLAVSDTLSAFNNNAGVLDPGNVGNYLCGGCTYKQFGTASLGLGQFPTVQVNAPTFMGEGTATFTIGSAAGTGATTPICIAGYVCDSVSGTFSFTTGTSTTTTGTVLTVTLGGVTRAHNASCNGVITVGSTGAPTTVGGSYGTTTQLPFNATGVALTASTGYSGHYDCH